jgi:RNA polymerase sigma-70 factor (ECF subfamily)
MADPEIRADAPVLDEASVSDARLVELVRQGDRDAFGDLVRRYENRLISVVRRFVRDWEMARDLAQEAFLKAYERLDQFDPSRRFAPWLFRIGVNVALDHLRKTKRRGWLGLFSQRRDERPVDPPMRDPRLAQDLEQEVHTVLQMIPENYRMVLVLRDLENFSTSEIAAITNRKEATIRWRLAEARKEFQRLWTERQQRQGGAPRNAPDTVTPTEDQGTDHALEQ